MMKCPAAIAAAITMVMITFGGAGAIEVQPSGLLEISGGWAGNSGFIKARNGDSEDTFFAAQLFRPRFRFISGDALHAVLEFEIGPMGWGVSNDDEEFGGGGLDADGKVVKVRNAYLQWSPLEKLSVRMGTQGVALPSAAFGNPVLDADITGIVANYALDRNVGVTAFWLRPFDMGLDDSAHGGANLNDEMDMFGLTVPIRGEAFAVTPWAMYARIGNNSGYWDYLSEVSSGYTLSDTADLGGSSNAWWLGGAFELGMFGPFAVKLDAMYGKMSGNDAPQFSGWLVAGLFEYASDAGWGNPGLIAWYASGDGGNDYAKGKHGKYGRLPIVGNDNRGFEPTAYAYAGALECMTDSLLSTSGVGSWGVGLQLDDFSFMERLSHTARIVYVRGTNDEAMIRNGSGERYGSPYNIMGDTVYMTKKDYAVTADFLSVYEVNENLSLHLETGFIHLNLDPAVWGSNADTTNAWRVQLGLEYTF